MLIVIIIIIIILIITNNISHNSTTVKPQEQKTRCLDLQRAIDSIPSDSAASLGLSASCFWIFGGFGDFAGLGFGFFFWAV